MITNLTNFINQRMNNVKFAVNLSWKMKCLKYSLALTSFTRYAPRIGLSEKMNALLANISLSDAFYQYSFSTFICRDDNENPVELILNVSSLWFLMRLPSHLTTGTAHEFPTPWYRVVGLDPGISV